MELKQMLYDACKRYLEERLQSLLAARNTLQQDANEETKSSAGDKYETGRAMAHLEMEKLQSQVADVNQMLNDLSRIKPDDSSPVIKPGSLVFTSRGNFFIAVNAGEHRLHGETFFAVSAASPIAQKMRGLKAGEEFTLNSRPFSITAVQ